MKKFAALSILIMFALCLLSCSRTLQTESLTTSVNQNAFLKMLKDSSEKLQQKPTDKISVVYILRQGNNFSIRSSYTPIGKFIDEKIRSSYTFKSEHLTDHQKTMIDTFVKNSILSDTAFVLRSDGTNTINLVIVAYMREYTYKKELYFDVYDFNNGDQVGRLQYEMSDVTYKFEQKR